MNTFLRGKILIRWLCLLSALLSFLLAMPIQTAEAAGGGHVAQPVYHDETGKAQYSHFPVPLSVYEQEEKEAGITGVWDKLVSRVQKDPFNLAVTLVFLGAIIHTFLAGKFERISHHLALKHKAKLQKSGYRIMHPEERRPISFLSAVFHFLGEVEAVFGIWIIPFLFVCNRYYSFEDFKLYLNYDCSFTEPLFVMVVMIIASSRPVFKLAESVLHLGARLGQSTPSSWWLSVMCLSPLLGSLITEPAAMTIGALLLAKKFYNLKPSKPLMYATLGLLFVNISVGGTFSSFAAPPVVMVAEKWGWDTMHMIGHFGWKALVAILISNFVYFVIFRKEFRRLNELNAATISDFGDAVPLAWEDRKDSIPIWVTIAHVFFLGWTVYFSHVPALFIGGFLFYMGFTLTTPQFQNNMTIKVPMMVAFFLAGLVILGGVQAWWLQPVLMGLNADFVMIGATILTAFNDNAAVTFLASTVPDLSDSVRYAVVAGAVTGGGLTVIANAPNPAGQAILGKFFKGINPLWLFAFAIFPTLIVYVLFTCFGT